MRRSNRNTKCGVTLLLSLITLSSSAQFTAVTECYPTVSKSLCGVETFEREKFINLAGSSVEASTKTTPEQADYLFKKLDIKFGRGLGLVKNVSANGKMLIEDKSRPGYADIKHLRSRLKSDDPSKYAYFKSIFGKNEGMAVHGKSDAYPDFMEKYNVTKSQNPHAAFPVNTDAAGEIVANILKYKFDDFTRPQLFEPINEPSWEVWKDERFIKFHTDIKRHVSAMGLDVAVGGPCLSVSNFYNKAYSSVNSLYNFIDSTNFELDFYSFHSYDYYTWNKETKEFEGQINSGAPLEGVLDALASYTYNKYGKELSYVATEHGGYMPGKSYGVPQDGDTRKEAFDYYAKKYFPGDGFDYEIKRRSVDNSLMLSSAISNTMVYMNQPHIVRKAVPFILLDTSNWDPYYYATLLVRDDFEKGNSSSTICPLIYFYEFFKGVEGVFTHSWCDSGDIQHLAYRNGNELILLYHNVSNESGEVKINFHDFDQKLKGVEIRRVGHDQQSRVPYLKSETQSNISSFKIAPQESVAIFISTKGKVANSETLKESAHYATEQSVQFKASHTFELNIDDSASIKESTLRVGINRPNNIPEGISIKLNGVELKSEVESSANRYMGKNGYTTTRMIHIPKGVVKEKNSVEVSFADGGEGGVGAVVLRALR